MIPIDKIENTETCFIQLWLMLERTRQLLEGQYKRYCIRRILKTWFGQNATDDFIFEVCNRCEREGMEILPSPEFYPRPHRELLRAVVATVLHLSPCKVNLEALDSAYSIAFPHSTPLNVNKKHRPP